MAYVYKHRRLDTGKVFYIGIGKNDFDNYKRMYSKSGRSIYWKNIVEKCGFTSELYLTHITWDEACIAEKALINVYGRKHEEDGYLCNLTSGGEGVVGYIADERLCKNRSIIAKERLKDKTKHPMYGKKHKYESLIKISKSKLGKKASDELKKKLSIARKGGLNSRAIIILNIENGIYYDCIKDAALSIGMNYGTLKNRLIGKLKNNTYLIKT
jgi:hypothetical protein